MFPPILVDIEAIEKHVQSYKFPSKELMEVKKGLFISKLDLRAEFVYRNFENLTDRKRLQNFFWT